MNKTICAADVDESAKIRQRGDSTDANFTFFEVINNAFLEGFAGFGTCSAFGKDEAATFAVNFNDDDINFFANHLAPTLFRGIPCHGRAAGKADL